MKITKEFYKYVSQNVLGMLGLSCYIIADTFFISVAAGADGITVLNLSLPIYNLIFAIGSMIGVGAATRYAILKAQGDDSANSYFSNSILWILIICVLLVLTGVLGPDTILRIMGGDDRIVNLGKGYARIVLIFSPFFMINYTCTSFVRNDNEPSRAMIATLTSSLSNIVLDYVFMFPLRMGIEGAALATVVSPIISIAICSGHFLSKKSTLRIEFHKPSINKLWNSCVLGTSAFIGEFASGVTITVFNYLIIGLVGNIGVAAYGVVANFAIVATAFFNGVSQGSQPLLSRAYGSENHADLKKILKMSIITILVIFGAIYVVVFFATDILVDLFNSQGSRELALYAFDGMRIYFTGFLFAGFNIVGSGFLAATDHPASSFAVSIVRGMIAIVGCAFLLSTLFGFTGIWASFVAAEAIASVITLAALRYAMR